MIPVSTKYKLQQFFFVQISWMIAAAFFSVIRYTARESVTQPGILDEPISPFVLLAYTSMVGLVVGSLIGMMVVFVHPMVAQRKSFIGGLLMKLSGFLMVVFVITTLALYAFYHARGSDQALELTMAAISSRSSAVLYVYGILVNLLLDFILQLNQRLGPGMIINIMTGKYFKPKIERRIFMFLDLASSTAIAEQLGHVRFSLLLQDCYNDLSEILLQYNATTYQYVGDEAVITWTFERGIKDNNCIEFFYAYKQLLHSKKAYYQHKYGFVPGFPAAINAGEVTVTEVGQIKSELAYHGDVLNAASRVQKLCKVYQQDLLITECLVEHLTDITAEKLDTVMVEGRKSPIAIYRLCRDTESMLASA